MRTPIPQEGTSTAPTSMRVLQVRCLSRRYLTMTTDVAGTSRMNSCAPLGFPPHSAATTRTGIRSRSLRSACTTAPSNSVPISEHPAGGSSTVTRAETRSGANHAMLTVVTNAAPASARATAPMRVRVVILLITARESEARASTSRSGAASPSGCLPPPNQFATRPNGVRLSSASESEYIEPAIRKLAARSNKTSVSTAKKIPTVVSRPPQSEKTIPATNAAAAVATSDARERARTRWDSTARVM